jgi:TetR/AcrR family transcriptional regulator, cholesterol catabolism regulator
LPAIQAPEPPPAPDGLTLAQRQRRARILEAGTELLAVREYDQIQMRDVAERADVALGTLYRYFTSKEHVFSAVIVQWAGSLQRQVGRHPLVGATNAERLSDVFQRAVRAFQRQPQFYRVIMMMQASADPFAREYSEQLSKATLQTFAGALEGLPEDVAIGIVAVSEAVLDTNLRSWAMGRTPISAVNQALEAAAHLLLEFHDD